MVQRAADNQPEPGLVGAAVAQVKRFWLHQANLSMNHLIVRKLLGREASIEESRYQSSSRHRPN